MDFLRFVAAVLFGGLVYFTALTDTPTELGILGFGIMMSAGWSEARFERVMKAINAKWGVNG